MSDGFSRELIQRLREARHILVLSGAGASAESGIPTFRDALTGLWERFDPSQLATAEAFQADPEMVWGWQEWQRTLAARCQPNPGHLAIARLQTLVPHVTVATQNVDDLHERAGSDTVVHLHGSIHSSRCFDCGVDWAGPVPTEAELSADAPEGGRRLAPPRCLDCGGMIRPGVVWFGEPMPQREWSIAEYAAMACDVAIVVGTSSVVYPAAELPRLAHSWGALVVEVNLERGGLEDLGGHFLGGAAGQVLPALVDTAWP